MQQGSELKVLSRYSCAMVDVAKYRGTCSGNSAENVCKLRKYCAKYVYEIKLWDEINEPYDRRFEGFNFWDSLIYNRDRSLEWLKIATIFIYHTSGLRNICCSFMVQYCV